MAIRPLRPQSANVQSYLPLPDVTKGFLNYYYPAIDEEALAHSIIKLLNNRPKQETLNKIANIYCECYSPQKQAENILQLLYNVAHQ